MSFIAAFPELWGSVGLCVPWTIKRGQECPVSKRDAWKEQAGDVTAGGRDRRGLLTLSPVKLETGAFVENLFWFCKHADESHPRP